MPIHFRTKSGREIAAPRTIEAAINQIVENLTVEELTFIKANDSATIHFTTGMSIRNEWGLWKESSPIKKDFKKRFNLWGMADDISGIILAGVWAKVLGKDVDAVLQQTAEKFRKHWTNSGLNPETGEVVGPENSTWSMEYDSDDCSWRLNE